MKCGTCGDDFDPASLQSVLFHEHTNVPLPVPDVRGEAVPAGRGRMVVYDSVPVPALARRRMRSESIFHQSRDVWRYVLVKMTKETLPAIAAVIAIIGWRAEALVILFSAVPLGVLVDLTFYHALKRTKNLGDEDD